MKGPCQGHLGEVSLLSVWVTELLRPGAHEQLAGQNQDVVLGLSTFCRKSKIKPFLVDLLQEQMDGFSQSLLMSMPESIYLP